MLMILIPPRDPDMISITSAPEAPAPRIRILDSRAKEVKMPIPSSTKSLNQQQQQQHHLHHPLNLRIIYSFAGWNGKNRRPSHLPHRNPREDTLRHLCKVGIFPDDCNSTHCAQHHYHHDSPPQELRGNGKGLKIDFPDHRRERLSGWPDHLPKVVLS